MDFQLIYYVGRDWSWRRRHKDFCHWIFDPTKTREAHEEIFNQKNASQHRRPSTPPSFLCLCPHPRSSPPSSRPSLDWRRWPHSLPLPLSFSLLWSAVIRKPLHGHPPRDQWDSGHVTGAQEDIPDVFRAWESRIMISNSIQRGERELPAQFALPAAWSGLVLAGLFRCFALSPGS